MIKYIGIFTKEVDSSMVKKDNDFKSISKAWDNLVKMKDSGKLLFDSSGTGWMRFKHPVKDYYVQLSGYSKWVNYGKEDESLIYGQSIHFYKC